jgi:hypothetical protein
MSVFARASGSYDSAVSREPPKISPILSQFLWLGVLFIVGALLYRYWRDIVRGLKRFDAKNAARQQEEWNALFDSSAHYRQTVKLAEEQFEPVQEYPYSDPRTGMKMTRFVFQGEDYETREHAEAARRAAIIERARAFYIEMDTIMLRRGAQHERTPDAKGLPKPRQGE